jgi:hypothetical protein
MALQTKPFLQRSRAIRGSRSTAWWALEALRALDGAFRGRAQTRSCFPSGRATALRAIEALRALDGGASARVYAMNDEIKHEKFSKNEILFC